MDSTCSQMLEGGCRMHRPRQCMQVLGSQAARCDEMTVAVQVKLWSLLTSDFQDHVGNTGNCHELVTVLKLGKQPWRGRSTVCSQARDPPGGRSHRA